MMVLPFLIRIDTNLIVDTIQVKIIQLLMNQKSSIQQISKQLDIPIATTYRIMKKFSKNKLLELESVNEKRGPPTTIYWCNKKEIKIKITAIEIIKNY